MQKTLRLSSIALLAQLAIASFAAPFTPGNLVVSRVGDGTAALTSAATAVFLDEYTPAGVLVQTIAIPTVALGNQRACTNSGSATSEGFIQRAADLKSLTVVGYDAPAGTAGVVGTSVATVNRVVGLVKADGTVDTSTNITDGYDANNIRSSTSADMTGFWTAGTGTTVTGGVRWIPFGPGNVSTQISNTVTNTRSVKIYNGQLYVSTGSGAFKGVNMVGTGLPTTSGQTTVLLPGFDGTTASTASPYDYAFADANTLYVADDRAKTAGGGLQKWTFDGSVWTLQYTISDGLGGTNGVRGLTVVPDAGGNIVYTTSTEANANFIMKVVDTGAASTFAPLAQAPALTRFRGLTLSPEVGGPTTETLAPTAEAISLGTSGSGGDLASWAADDNNARTICKLFVPNSTSPFIRADLTYTTSKTTAAAISFDVKVSTHTPGPQGLTLYVKNQTTNTFVVTSVNNANIVNGTTYNGVPTGTLSDYLGTGGAMNGRIEVKQTGPSTSLFPCASFEFGQMVVTG